MNKLPEFPRYEFVYQRACEFIISQPVSLLPADPFRLIERNRWGLVSYRQLAHQMKVPVQDIVEAVQGRSGFTVFNGANYCIAYNSDIEVFSRIVFALFHEIGHIYLGHFAQQQPSDELSDKARRVLELEANYFASNVMAPSIVIERCGLKSIDSLCCACGMSCNDAETRLLHFKNWSLSELDLRVQDTMLEYIRVTRRPRMSMRSIDIWCEETELAVRQRWGLQAGSLK